MKAIELPAYRAFMFAVIPQLYQAHCSRTTSEQALLNAISEAEFLWGAIDKHVLQVTKNIEND